MKEKTNLKIENKENLEKDSIAVIIGRFQIHQLHEAHCGLIEEVLSNHKRVILFLGVSPVIGSTFNPLDFNSRKLMIQEKYPELVILSLPDTRDDETWSKNLDSRVREIFPIGNVLLYGSRDSFIPHYKGQFETTELEQRIYVSAREIRKQISEEIKSSSEWRAGVIYGSYNRYPISYQTVDVAVFNDDESQILLARKPEENKYRFVGGFVNPDDNSLEQAASREFKEETGSDILITSYIGSFRILDWRYKSERDKIMTTLFKAKYTSGHLSPSDDIEELRWFNVNEELKNNNGILKNIIEEHQSLMSILLTKIK